MTDEVEKPRGPAAQGATDAELDPGSLGKGNPAPVVSNYPPDDDGEEVRDPSTGKVTKKAATADTQEVPPENKEVPKEVPKETPQEEELTDYVKLDHPEGQAAINILRDRGITAAEANKFFKAAIEASDFSKIDVKGLEDAVGKDTALLVMSGARKYWDDKQAQVSETTSTVYTALGGEENWLTLREWAQTTEKKDPGVKKRVDAIRKMIDQGPVQAEMAVRELKRMYDADPNTKGLAVGKVQTGDKVDYSGVSPLTRAEYVKKLDEAYSRNASKTEIAALHLGRKAGMAAGIR